MTERLSGTVVSYNDDRGFGFIRPDDDGADYFVRWTEIKRSGFRSLVQGQRVRFEPIETAGERQALAVERLSAAERSPAEP